jgi:hypothetical protein
VRFAAVMLGIFIGACILGMMGVAPWISAVAGGIIALMTLRPGNRGA